MPRAGIRDHDHSDYPATARAIGLQAGLDSIEVLSGDDMKP